MTCHKDESFYCKGICRTANKAHLKFIAFAVNRKRLSVTEGETPDPEVVTVPLAEITVGVIDDDIFEEDEYFYVHLSNPRVVGHPEVGAAPTDASATPKAVLGDNHTATVTIYDDDHAGKNKH